MNFDVLRNGFSSALNEARTSKSHPIHISWIIPPELTFSKERMEDAILADGDRCRDKDLLNYILENPFSSSADDNRHITHGDTSHFTEHLQIDQDETGINGITPVVVASLEEHHSLSSPARFPWIGNICLSGCPGKKVRLDTGPINGRAMVNRDLDDDFARLREFDVECSVCCLDDTELAYLGADWPKYEAAAKRNFIEVLRLPIEEGFPPKSVALAHELVRQIDDRLMSGKNVLIHCRGGIGRAGVIACCLLLYKGLVRTPARAVQLLRIRRSRKGIETPTQAAFLIKYAKSLHRMWTLNKVPRDVLRYIAYPHVSKTGVVSTIAAASIEIPSFASDIRTCSPEELEEPISTVKGIDQEITTSLLSNIENMQLELGNALSVSWVRIPNANV